MTIRDVLLHKGFSIRLFGEPSIHFEFDTKENIEQIAIFKNVLAHELNIPKNDFDLVSAAGTIRDENESTIEESWLQIHTDSVAFLARIGL
jgi:hypothetical protein